VVVVAVVCGSKQAIGHSGARVPSKQSRFSDFPHRESKVKQTGLASLIDNLS